MLTLSDLKICFLGCDRVGSIRALNYIADNITTNVVCVVPKIVYDNKLACMCRELGIAIYDMETFELNDECYDLGISYLYSKLISIKQMNKCKDGIINFHPAPLPEYKGVSGICYAICNDYAEWGVTCHYVEEKFDTGQIIEVRRFPLHGGCTGIEGSNIVQREMFDLFVKIINRYKKNGKLASSVQEKIGAYHSRKEIENMKKVTGMETEIELRNKVHGLFFPPYHGAYIEINGIKYTLVDEEILQKISSLINEDF